MDRKTFENILDWISNQNGGSIGQVSAPLFWLVNKVEQVNPHTILEIGLGIGGSMKVWEQVLSPNDLYVGLDIRETIYEELFWNWKDSNRRIKVLTGDSIKSESVGMAKQALEGREVDFLYLDGCHDYDHVKFEFENYGAFVKSGGLVGFHDVEGHYSERHEYSDGSVKHFFVELEGKKEFSSRWMRPFTGPPPILKGDSPFIKDCKEMLKKRHVYTEANGLTCTGIWWKP